LALGRSSVAADSPAMGVVLVLVVMAVVVAVGVVVVSVVVSVVVMVVPGLCGPGRVPASRGRAVALRVEPLSKAQHLAPDGRPSLTQHGQAGGAG
jgi:hypothetical protein